MPQELVCWNILDYFLGCYFEVTVIVFILAAVAGAIAAILFV